MKDSEYITALTGQIVKVQDDYPFGEVLRSYTAGGYNKKYLFTEKERDQETGYDYFGARYYDSYIGRWLSVDPLADKYPGWSPYNYCLNNPLRYIDPNGMYSAETQDGSFPEDDDPREKKVGVDPGHGDQHSNSQIDPGTTNGEDLEKDIVLNISNVVSSELQAAGFSTIQSRNGDITTKGKRIAWRKEALEGADILVSIHVNGARNNPKANGFEVLYYSNGSKSLAESISNSNTLFNNRGIKHRDNLGMLKGAKPSVIVEAGFISNKGDLNVLKNQYNQVGKDITNGIINYLRGSK